MSVTLPGTTVRPGPDGDGPDDGCEGHAAGDARDTYHRLVAELRDVEHWRRLVAARLDLAVAAVADIDEPVGHPVDGATPPPTDLRGLLGIRTGDGACAEAAGLVRLRTVLADLDAYARALRPGVAAAARAAGVPRARTVPRRRLTAVPDPANSLPAVPAQRRPGRDS